MAKFKVGDRVRHVIAGEVPLGSEGTVVGSGMQSMGFRYNVEFDRVPCPYPPGIYWYSAPEWLAPLTPPAEDAWAADQVKKWTKPDPTVPLTKPIRTYSDLVDAVQDQILLWP
jgi:hypothetical protein